jgi:DNA-binding NarL/FixJ family response regulator
MNLYIYLPDISEKGRRLLDSVRLLPPGINTEVFDTRSALVRRLRQPKVDSLIIVLFDPSHEDLEGLRDVRELLVSVPLLLVLSDQDLPTMALAHRLLPSYISYIDSDMTQLFSVIRKLLPASQEARKI